MIKYFLFILNFSFQIIFSFQMEEGLNCHQFKENDCVREYFSSLFPVKKVLEISRSSLTYAYSKDQKDPSFFRSIDTYVLLTGDTQVTTLEPMPSKRKRYEAFAELVSQDPDLRQKSIIISGFRGLGLPALTTKSNLALSEADSAMLIVMNILQSKVKFSNIFKEQSSFDSIGNAWFSLEILDKIQAKNIMLVSAPGHIQRALIIFLSINELFYEKKEFNFHGVGAWNEPIAKNFETPANELIKIDQFLYKLEIYDTKKRFLNFMYQHQVPENCQNYADYNEEIRMNCEFAKSIYLKERSKVTEEEFKKDKEYYVKYIFE